MPRRGDISNGGWNTQINLRAGIAPLQMSKLSPTIPARSGGQAETWRSSSGRPSRASYTNKRGVQTTIIVVANTSFHDVECRSRQYAVKIVGNIATPRCSTQYTGRMGRVCLKEPGPHAALLFTGGKPPARATGRRCICRDGNHSAEPRHSRGIPLADQAPDRTHAT